MTLLGLRFAFFHGRPCLRRRVKRIRLPTRRFALSAWAPFRQLCLLNYCPSITLWVTRSMPLPTDCTFSGAGVSMRRGKSVSPKASTIGEN